MNDIRIAATCKSLPPFSRTTEEIIPYVDGWLGTQPDRFRRKVLKIFEGAGVDKRYGIMDLPEVFTQTSFEEKNALYAREVKKLGYSALQTALREAEWKPESLDFILTVSCTGIMIPSLDAYLVNALGLRQDIIRLPVTEMGCAAGVSGLIYATHFLRANPGKRLALVAVESPTATFQLEDFSMANMVSAAIFGDGAACVLLSSEKDAKGPTIRAGGMYHFPDATNLMGFDLTNGGLKMILDPAVPETIDAHFDRVIFPFLEEHQCGIEEVKHLIFHPGGRKIVQAVESRFRPLGKNIEDTRETLRLYGNMSSVTVLYVLERFLAKAIPAGDLGLMLSFGPGFTAQRLLIQW